VGSNKLLIVRFGVLFQKPSIGLQQL